MQLGSKQWVVSTFCPIKRTLPSATGAKPNGQKSIESIKSIACEIQTDTILLNQSMNCSQPSTDVKPRQRPERAGACHKIARDDLHQPHTDSPTQHATGCENVLRCKRLDVLNFQRKGFGWTCWTCWTCSPGSPASRNISEISPFSCQVKTYQVASKLQSFLDLRHMFHSRYVSINEYF